MEHRAQCAHDRRVGQLAVGELQAFADEHELAVGHRTPFELGDQAALADAGVAGDHDRARLLLKSFQLPLATHEPLARNAPTHTAIIHIALTGLNDSRQR